MNLLSPSHAVWNLGFRPLYFAAAAWFVMALFLWLSAYAHGLPLNSHLSPLDWHAHEMLFGFTGAVIVGFLFTAVRNWTAMDTPRGRHLQIIVFLWVFARASNMSNSAWIALFADMSFFLAAAHGIGRPLIARKNRRNYLFIVALIIFAVLSSLHHLTAMSLINGVASADVLQAVLALIVVVVTVMAGRVVPMFTKNPLPHVQIKQWPLIENALLPLTFIWLLSELFHLNHLRFGVAGILAVLHAIRLSGWGGQHTLKTPMLWILHLAYAWLVVGFALRFSGYFSPLALMLSTHALTAGTISSLCIGMMARTARGHTGRAIHASKVEITAFILMLLATVFRVIFPLISPSHYTIFIALAGVLAMLAFVLYLYRFSPWLFSARADGRPD